jgi:hypothetical protein
MPDSTMPSKVPREQAREGLERGRQRLPGRFQAVAADK